MWAISAASIIRLSIGCGRLMRVYKLNVKVVCGSFSSVGRFVRPEKGCVELAEEEDALMSKCCG